MIRASATLYIHCDIYDKEHQMQINTRTFSQKNSRQKKMTKISELKWVVYAGARKFARGQGQALNFWPWTLSAARAAAFITKIELLGNTTWCLLHLFILRHLCYTTLKYIYLFIAHLTKKEKSSLISLVSTP